MAKAKLTTQCPICGKVVYIEVESADYEKFKSCHLFVQEAFPYLSAEERECLIPGICPYCWNKTFPSEENEE